MASEELIKAIAVTAELCGRVFSEAAAQVFVDDLKNYPEPQVLEALVRCRKEVRGMLTLQDVVSRLEDGRPGPEEAWAMIPIREDQSAVWTVEMSQSFGVALPLINEGEMVAARMAFKENYQRMVSQARDKAKSVHWMVTLGHDPAGREPVLREAVARGRISVEDARGYCPALLAPSEEVLRIEGPERRAEVSELLRKTAAKLRSVA